MGRAFAMAKGLSPCFRAIIPVISASCFSRPRTGGTIMLDFIRKRAKSWALRIVLFAVAATFALWGIGGFIGEDQSAVISVDGEKIPYSDYARTRDRLVESYRALMGGSLDAKAINDLKIRESAVDFLLERALLARTAD